MALETRSTNFNAIFLSNGPATGLSFDEINSHFEYAGYDKLSAAIKRVDSDEDDDNEDEDDFDEDDEDIEDDEYEDDEEEDDEEDDDDDDDEEDDDEEDEELDLV